MSSQFGNEQFSRKVKKIKELRVPPLAGTSDSVDSSASGGLTQRLEKRAISGWKPRDGSRRKTYKEIAAILNERGLKTRKGKEFTGQIVASILCRC